MLFFICCSFIVLKVSNEAPLTIFHALFSLKMHWYSSYCSFTILVHLTVAL